MHGTMMLIRAVQRSIFAGTRAVPTHRLDQQSTISISTSSLHHLLNAAISDGTPENIANHYAVMVSKNLETLEISVRPAPAALLLFPWTR